MDEMKKNVQGMVKRRKDSGFTLIELMIVIAVIGILAVVLMPKVTNVKTSAKSAGVDTNVRAVQAYAQSRISYWDTLPDTSSIQPDINAALGSGGSDPLKNPITGSDALVFGAPAGSSGTVYVVVPADQATLTNNGIIITGIDGNKAISSTATVKP